jgi:hypothetical protein
MQIIVVKKITSSHIFLMEITSCIFPLIKVKVVLIFLCGKSFNKDRNIHLHPIGTALTKIYVSQKFKMICILKF